MGNVGKDPHRPDEGKAGAAEWDPGRRWEEGQRAEKDQADRDRRRILERGDPATTVGEEPVGGSRPGVRSRVREAIGRRKETAPREWVEGAEE